jgi:hypothetical protein
MHNNELGQWRMSEMNAPMHSATESEDFQIMGVER